MNTLPADVSGGVWSPTHRALTIGLLLTVGSGAFEALAVGTVLPAVNAELHDLGRYGLVFSAFLLTNLIGVVVAGRWADRAPATRPFVAGALLFGTGLVIAGTSTSMLVLALGRGLQGLGAGAVAALAYYVVQRCYDEAARPRMLALLSTAWVIPGLLGPSLAALITDRLGWRWVFLALVPAMPLAALLTTPALRAATRSSRGEADSARSMITLAVAVALALAALSLRSGPFAIGAAIVAVAVGAPALAALLPRGTIRLRAGQPAATAVILLAATGYFAVEAFVPLSLVSLHGAAIAQSGLVLTAASLTWAAGTWLQARLVPTTSRRRLLAAGCATIAIGVSATGVIASTPGLPFWMAAGTWAVAGFGMGLCSSTAVLVVLEWSSPGQEGRASSAAQLANLLGAAVGTGAGGALVAAAVRDSVGLATAVRAVTALGAAAAVTAGIAALRARSAPAGAP
jgi:MFS family permease